MQSLIRSHLFSFSYVLNLNITCATCSVENAALKQVKVNKKGKIKKTKEQKRQCSQF